MTGLISQFHWKQLIRAGRWLRRSTWETAGQAVGTRLRTCYAATSNQAHCRHDSARHSTQHTLHWYFFEWGNATPFLTHVPLEAAPL